MQYSIPNYSEDRSVDIGKHNLEALRKGKGKIKFTGAYIHLSSICNFKCEGCFTHVKVTKTTRLKFRTIRRIVDFAKDRGVQSIIFAGAGEPTLDPEYKKIVSYIQKQKLQTVLFTNLTTLKNKNQAKKILKSGPVIAKLYTLNEQKYNRITHSKNAFKTAMKGLKLLLKTGEDLEKQGKKTTLAIDSYITKENYMDLPDLLRFCRENNIIPYFEAFIELGQSEKIIKKLFLTEEKLTKLFLKLQKIDKEEFDINTPIHSWSRHYGMDVCRKTTHMFSVREDGNVYMCVCSLKKVGNVFDQKDPYESLERIFNVKNSWLLNYFVCDKCSKLINPKFLK